jgi:hypothetical protein
MSWTAKLDHARADIVKRDADPWRRLIERALPAGVTSISTRVLLELIDMPANSGNARRLARTMRSLGFVPLKSRRLTPGGFRDTTIRGWARPLREPKLPPATAAGGEPIGGCNEVHVYTQSS